MSGEQRLARNPVARRGGVGMPDAEMGKMWYRQGKEIKTHSLKTLQMMSLQGLSILKKHIFIPDTLLIMDCTPCSCKIYECAVGSFDFTDFFSLSGI